MFNPIFSRARSGLVLAAVLLGGMFPGCQKGEEKAAKPSPKVPPMVTVALVESRAFPATIKVQGSLMGDEHAVVGVKVAGRVRDVQVDIGSRVERGDTLAILDLEDFQVRIKQAQSEEQSIRAKLGLKPEQDAERMERTAAPSVVQEKAHVDGAKLAFDRAVALDRGRAISAEELQVQQTALKVAQARYVASLHNIDEQIALLQEKSSALALAKQALKDATVTAPFDGIVSVRHAAPGVFLHVGDPVVHLVRTNPLRFHAGVPERHSLLVEVGQAVRITIEGRESPLVGKISRISPMLNLASRSLPIEVDVPNADFRLRAGLFAEAEIVVNPKASCLTVPASAIIEFAGVEKVCVVEDQKAILRKIVTGRKIGDRVEVVEGLHAKEQVIVDGKAARPGPVAAAIGVPGQTAKGPALATTERPPG